MALILDTGPLIALMDRRDPFQARVERVLKAEAGQLVVSAQVTAEVDYLVGQRLGRAARRAFLEDLSVGRFRVACLDEGDYALASGYDVQYQDLDVGLTDLSIVVLAHRFRTRRIMTFDERHFRALRPMDGGSFVLLPRDAEARHR